MELDRKHSNREVGQQVVSRRVVEESNLEELAKKKSNLGENLCFDVFLDWVYVDYTC